MRKLRLFISMLFVLAVVSFGIFMFYEHVVYDDTPPEITSEFEIIECSVNGDETDLMIGLTASDFNDGDLTDKIMVEGISQLVTKDTAKITYVVFDSTNNVARLTRYVRYTDYELPKFKLSEPLIFARGSEITVFDKLSASDVIDGDLSDNIRVTTQNLITTEEGEYSITVQATNSMGDTASIPLTVMINSSNVRKQLVKLSEYLVYTEIGEEFDPMKYVSNVYNSDGTSAAKTRVDVESDVDTSTAGVYEVRYSYADGGNEYTTILTVVVE